MFIQEKRYGRIKIYRFKDENMKARSLKNLISFWENENEFIVIRYLLGFLA